MLKFVYFGNVECIYFESFLSQPLTGAYKTYMGEFDVMISFQEERKGTNEARVENER